MRMRTWVPLLSCLGACGLLTGGCPDPTQFDSPANFTRVDQIVMNTDLTPMERREELRALGLSDLQINSFLRDERLGNQFGGDLGTAFAKVTGGEFSELTPDEAQVYGDEATAIDAAVSASLSDGNAQAIVNLFRDENLNTAGQLGAFLDDPANALKIPATIPDGVLRRLFVDFDPQRVADSLP